MPSSQMENLTPFVSLLQTLSSFYSCQPLLHKLLFISSTALLCTQWTPKTSSNPPNPLSSPLTGFSPQPSTIRGVPLVSSLSFQPHYFHHCFIFIILLEAFHSPLLLITFLSRKQIFFYRNLSVTGIFLKVVPIFNGTVGRSIIIKG